MLENIITVIAEYHQKYENVKWIFGYPYEDARWDLINRRHTREMHDILVAGQALFKCLNEGYVVDTNISLRDSQQWFEYISKKLRKYPRYLEAIEYGNSDFTRDNNLDYPEV